MYDYGYDEQGTSEALAALSLQAGDDPTFYADSGATTHMTNDVGKLISAHTYNGRDAIYVGNGNKLPISHTGNALLKTSHGNLKLKDVLVVPKLRKNLLSISQLTHDNVSLFAFDANGFVIKDQNQRTLAKGHKKGQLYALDEAQALALAAIKTPSAPSTLWHQRMGHPHSRLLQVLYSKKVLNISSWLNKNSICTSCQLGKRCKLSFYDSKNHCQFPLEKIYCDLWGPVPIFSMQHFKYYVIFVDDCTRYTWLFPLKHKSDFYECFLKFQKLVENQFERKIKIFQSDGGGEFTSNLFTNHLAQCGIAQQLSCPNTPEQNGVAERKHQHIVETGLTMIFHATLPLKFWVHAFLTATFLINQLPSSFLNMETPFSKLFAKNPNYNGLKVFGCKCFPYLRHHDQHKFAKKTFPCVFLGYSPIHKGYRCLDPTTNRVYLSRHVVFMKIVFLILINLLVLILYSLQSPLFLTKMNGSQNPKMDTLHKTPQKIMQSSPH